MSRKVYLFWQPFNGNEKELMIASLRKTEDKKYIFKYEKDALKAMELGCFLPIPVEDISNIEREITFNILPYFFNQRVLSINEFNTQKFGISSTHLDEFSLLTYNDGRRNSDNFSILDEDTYMARMNGNEESMSRVYGGRK